MSLPVVKPKQNFNLTSFNTLNIPSEAEYFVSVSSEAELLDAWHWAKAKDLPIRIIGGGSNILPIDKVEGLVIANRINGVQITDNTIELGAGENWHQCVLYCAKHGLSGIENLALIPGTVGAAPVQNIGAYGVELKDVFESLDALDLKTGEWVIFNSEDCQFSYRDSVFKQNPGRYCITKVRLKLSSNFEPILEYGPLQSMAHQKKLNPQELIDHICQLRSSKLPDPEKVPNAGSFFKNPVIAPVHFQRLKDQYPEIVAFAYQDEYKLAAGWLIEHAGFKGQADSNTGVAMYEKQALVLINPERKNLTTIMDFVSKVRQKVQSQFGVLLEVEPQIFG